MAHARELLQMTNSTVKEIAWKVGYCHASNFARDFKAEYRETPVTVRVSFQLEVKRATS
jgi:transcriptional regulator GlxA family with amidase domain